MLKSSRRLSSGEVEQILKEGRSLGAGHLRAKYTKDGKGTSRFAFVVSKKVAGGAVMRNKLRRWASLSAKAMSGSLSGYLVVVLVGKKYESLALIREDMAALLHRIAPTSIRP